MSSGLNSNTIWHMLIIGNTEYDLVELEFLSKYKYNQ